MSESSAYHLYCTVCKNSFDSPGEWSRHLPEIGHQRRARLACRRWNVSTKECVLVAFGSCSIADCDLVQRLSGGMRDLVTDFVWWKKKPNIGLLRFESRKKVDDVIRQTNSEVKIGDSNRVQLKRAVDYLELEWNVLLSLKADARLEAEPLECDAFRIKRENRSEEEDGDKEDSVVGQEIQADAVTDNTHTKTMNVVTPSSDSNPDFTTYRGVGDEDLASGKSKKKNATSPEHEKDNVPSPTKIKKAKTSTDIEKSGYSNRRKQNKLSSKTNEEHPMSLSPSTSENVEELLVQCITESSKYADREEAITIGEANFQANEEVIVIQSPPKTRGKNTRRRQNMKSASSENDFFPFTAILKSIPRGKEVDVIDLSSDNENGNENSKLTNESESKMKTKATTKENQSWKTHLSKLLRQQYVSIFKEILIPKEKFETALYLSRLLEEEFKKTVPWCKIIPFRHWYLGIKNCGNNELLLFLDYRRIWEQDKWNEKSCHEEKPKVISTFFKSPEKLFPDIQKLSKVSKRNSKSKHNQDEECFGVGFIHKPTDLKFRIICSIFVLHEVQTCELVKYLCQFDLNVLPLLGLVNYWASLNSLSFGNLRTTDPHKPTITPLPASLDWLVLSFLIKKKIIPSVRDILGKPHDKIIVCDKDIGFTNDPEFPKLWSSSPSLPLDEQIERIRRTTDDNEVYNVNNILLMLELLREFFMHYARIRSTRTRKRDVVLNTKDGSIIKTSVILKTENDIEKPPKQKMLLSEDELRTLREVSCLTDHQVSILHPIDLRFSLSFCGPKFSYMLSHAMLQTAKKIMDFFGTLKTKRKVGRAKRIDLIELLKVNVQEIGRKSAPTKVKTKLVSNGKRRISKKRTRIELKSLSKKGKGVSIRRSSKRQDVTSQFANCES